MGRKERKGLERERNRGIDGNGREQKGSEGNRKEWERNRQYMPENVREWKRTEGNRKDMEGNGRETNKTCKDKGRTGQERK